MGEGVGGGQTIKSLSAVFLADLERHWRVRPHCLTCRAPEGANRCASAFRMASPEKDPKGPGCRRDAP